MSERHSIDWDVGYLCLSRQLTRANCLLSRYPDYVVGRIVLIDEQTAVDGNNPYALHLGTTFYVLTVASLHES